MRPSRDHTFIHIALALAERSTCVRRAVGCVLTNARGHIIGTGYNGVATGLPHCFEANCEGASLPSGTGLDKCEAIHAEANALLQCHDVHQIHTAYCTHSPCVHCVKLLLNTSCQRIVFLHKYSHGESEGIWLRAKRGPWEQLLS